MAPVRQLVPRTRLHTVPSPVPSTVVTTLIVRQRVTSPAHVLSHRHIVLASLLILVALTKDTVMANHTDAAFLATTNDSSTA